MPPNTNVREMVLNHASLTAPDRHMAVCWLKDIAIGMIQLRIRKIAKSSLRSRCHEHEIWILPNFSLSDAYVALKMSGAREEARFLMRLSTKSPLLNEVKSDVSDRFLGCEGRQMPLEDSDPLILCAVTNWIAVSIPSDPDWDKDQLTVSFDELQPDESFQEINKTVDNLARSSHARLIFERHRATLINQNPSAAWEQKEAIFPNLDFGPDVKLPPEILGAALGKLEVLDKSAAEWLVVGGPAPPWACKVTRESETVRNNEGLLNARRFKSHQGTRKLFELHARIGSGFRIHLRIDAATKEVEIGYIGPHLPL